MLSKLSSFFQLFKAGEALANDGAWANRAAWAAFVGALVSVARAFGYDIQIDSADVGAGIVAFICAGSAVLHVVANRSAGVSTGN